MSPHVLHNFAPRGFRLTRHVEEDARKQLKNIKHYFLTHDQTTQLNRKTLYLLNIIITINIIIIIIIMWLNESTRFKPTLSRTFGKMLVS